MVAASMPSSLCRSFISDNLHRGTRRRVGGGGSPDLELEGMREDTRHKIYTGSGSQSSVPYVLFTVVLRPALGCCSPEGLWMCG
jgi:hypothetical protein